MNLSNISKKRESVTSLKTTIPLAFNVVFSKSVYIGIAAPVFTTFWIIQSFRNIPVGAAGPRIAMTTFGY